MENEIKNKEVLNYVESELLLEIQNKLSIDLHVKDYLGFNHRLKNELRFELFNELSIELYWELNTALQREIVG